MDITIIRNTIFVLLLFSFIDVRSQEIDQHLLKKLEKAGSRLDVDRPVDGEPVTLNTQCLWNKDKTQMAIIIKVSILEGWHIYSYVPSDQPYIISTIVFESSDCLKPLNDWQNPISNAYENNVLVYEGNILFKRIFKVEKCQEDIIIKAGLYYQCCDLQQCLMPKTKIKKINLK